MPISRFVSPLRKSLRSISYKTLALFFGLVCLAAFSSALAQQGISYYRTDVEPTSAGDLKITPIHHASLILQWQGKVIDVDPVGVPYFTGLPKADLILITHAHPDHMDPKTLALVRKPGTIFVVPAAVKKTVTEAQVVMSNGQSHTVNLAGVQIPIQAVAAYNIVHKTPKGQLFHPKGWGNGYVLTLGGKRIYLSGDTECIPEMKALKNIDIAFICMNLPYTMTPLEAASCVKDFRPKIVYPYHYRGQDPQAFANALKGQQGITVRLRNMYLNPPK